MLVGKDGFAQVFEWWLFSNFQCGVMHYLLSHTLFSLPVFIFQYVLRASLMQKMKHLKGREGGYSLHIFTFLVLGRKSYDDTIL